MSLNQFGFLAERQIHDVIGIMEEVIHSIKTKNMKALVLKMDLNKAFDKVNWTFLRLVLLYIRFNLEITNWIMGCVTSTNSLVLIMGPPLVTFPTLEVLDRGFLSPLLFLEEKQKGNIKDINVSPK